MEIGSVVAGQLVGIVLQLCMWYNFEERISCPFFVIFKNYWKVFCGQLVRQKKQNWRGHSGKLKKRSAGWSCTTWDGCLLSMLGQLTNPGCVLSCKDIISAHWSAKLAGGNKYVVVCFSIMQLKYHTHSSWVGSSNSALNCLTFTDFVLPFASVHPDLCTPCLPWNKPILS